MISTTGSHDADHFPVIACDRIMVDTFDELEESYPKTRAERRQELLTTRARLEN
jgi:hypothetical protein